MHKLEPKRKASAQRKTSVVHRNVARGLRGPSLLAARANLLRCLLRDGRLEKCVQLPM